MRSLARTDDHPRPVRGLEKQLLGLSWRECPTLLPGVIAAVVMAWLSVRASTFLGVNLMGFEKSPISAVTVAVVLGLLVGNLFRLPAALKPGLTFSVKKLLRLGIILLGIRLSIFDVFRLGARGVPVVLLTITSALVVTTLLNRWLKLPARLGTLIAVGTSICGVSAIVATTPAIDAEEEEVAYAVAVITTFGIVATLLYPYAANLLFAGDMIKAGLFLGTAIHDTSQVTGAGLVYADVFDAAQALDVATITKLVRNVFMMVVIPLMAFIYAKDPSRRGAATQEKTNLKKLLPMFIVGFLALAVIRSIGDAGLQSGNHAFGLWDATAWKGLYSAVKQWAVNFLVIALAGVGMSTDFCVIKGLGIKPFLVGLGAALVVGGVSIASITMLGW